MLQKMKNFIAEQMMKIGRFEVLSISFGNSQDKEGNIVTFTKLEVEIPRNNGVFSRERIIVKVLEPTPSKVYNLNSEELEVSFNGLIVSYINGNNVYWRADSYTIQKSIGLEDLL